MKILATRLEGAFTIEPEPIEDARGHFARTFDRAVFQARGMEWDFPEWSLSQNIRSGTLRGMHFQRSPWAETKLVGCTRGAIYDVLLDLRPDSPSFKSWTAVELASERPRLLYIPKGVAHGFQTLRDDTVVTYFISTPFRPEAATGVRWNDGAFEIVWPHAPTCISEKDAKYPDWNG